MLRAFLKGTGFSEYDTERMIEGDWKDQLVPGLGVSPRHLMITLGTDWGRKMVAEDVWTRAAIQTSHVIRDTGDHVVIDDLRTPDEYEAMVGAGATLVKVVRPGAEPASRLDGLLEDREFDIVINNDGYLEDLHRKALRLAQVVQRS